MAALLEAQRLGPREDNAVVLVVFSLAGYP